MGTSSNSEMKIDHKKKAHPRKSQKQIQNKNTAQNKNPNQNPNQNENQQQQLNEIDVNLIPYQNVKNKEVYLLKLVSKKLLITDNHISDGIKPTDEDNMIMTRLKIEIAEQYRCKKFFCDVNNIKLLRRL